MVAVRNSGHYGAAANYSMMALEHDMIGLSATNSPYVAMVPTFGRKAMLSTNPLPFAAPAGRHAPFVLDMATTTVAIGKLSVASRWNTPIPSGWALDDSGMPTTDPFVALKHMKDRRVQNVGHCLSTRSSALPQRTLALAPLA